jgi:hypothetical protein
MTTFIPQLKMKWNLPPELLPTQDCHKGNGFEKPCWRYPFYRRKEPRAVVFSEQKQLWVFFPALHSVPGFPLADSARGDQFEDG